MDEKFYRKHKREWFIGKKVRTLRTLRSRAIEIPKGTICEITDKFGGFGIRANPCSCCGVGIFMKKIPPEDVILTGNNDTHLIELTDRREALVKVDDPRYHGTGHLWSNPHRKTTLLDDNLIVVDVMLENGNVWEYPIDNVHLIKQ